VNGLKQDDFLQVAESTDQETFRTRLIHLADRMEFGIVAAVLVVESPGKPTIVNTLSNTPEAFLQASKDPEDGRRDPVLRRLMTSSRPVVYDQALYVEGGAGDLWEAQAPFGYRSGISLAMHLAGGQHFLFGMDRDQPLPASDVDLTRMVADIHLLAAYSQEAAIRLLQPQADVRPPARRLSPREREVLQWTAQGKTSWAVAQILSVSEHTVEFHVKNAMAKLGASNRNMAIARASALGLI
jgi:DNA-binding CsgD family transcriptional regulator